MKLGSETAIVWPDFLCGLVRLQAPIGYHLVTQSFADHLMKTVSASS